MVDIASIKHGIITPALNAIGLGGEAAICLVTGTGLVESGYRATVQSGGGPALGWFQMEPATYEDIWRNYLRYRPELSEAIASLCNGATPSASQLQTNSRFAAAMCRVKYLRSPLPLPKNTAFNLCQYWKQVYNTPLGKGQVDAQHISLFQAAIDA